MAGNYWLRSGAYTLMQRLSTALFGFAGFYLLVRMLPKTEFGIWALFITITAWIEVARNGLVQNAQIKFAAAAAEDEYPSILTSSFTLNALVTGLSSLVLLVLGLFAAQWFRQPDLQPMLWQYVLTTLVLLPFSQFTFVQQSQGDFKGVFYSYFVRQAVFFVGIAVYFIQKTKPDLPMLVFLQTGAAAAGALVSWSFARKYIRLARGIHWKGVWQQFHYGKFVFGTNLSSMLMTSVDQLMLAYLLGTASVAVYNAAFRINNLIDVPISSLAAIAFPHSVKMAAQEGPGALSNLYEKSTGILVGMLVPVLVVLVLFPEQIITIIASDKYLDAAPVLQYIALFSLVQPFLRQFGTLLDAIGKPAVNFMTITFLAAVNVVLNYVFISQWGVIGAARATLTCYLLALPITFFILNRFVPIRASAVISSLPLGWVHAWRLFSTKVLRKAAV